MSVTRPNGVLRRKSARQVFGGGVALSERKQRMLLGAMLHKFYDEAITGYLVDVRITCECALGVVYKGWGHCDGESIISGRIQEVLKSDGRWLIKTFDHDCYVVVNFHTHGGRLSLRYLTDLFDCAAYIGSRYCRH